MKAAAVPQIAMTTPANMTNPSKGLHLRSIITLAATGPTMASINAEKEPRNAIIELNSGMEMDTKTDKHVMPIRWTIASIFFNITARPDGAIVDMSLGFAAKSSGEDMEL